MSIFDEINISKATRIKISSFLVNPDLNTWNQICNTYITPKHTLWMAMALYQTSYINQYRNNSWQGAPDAITLARGIKMAIKKYNKSIQEENYFFPPPIAA